MDQVGLGELQRKDPKLQPLFLIAEGERESFTKFFQGGGFLMREWLPIECTLDDAEWKTVQQIMLP